MAKKTKFTTHDSSFNDSLDFPDLDFGGFDGGSKNSKDRKPVSEFTSGIKKGAKSAIFTPKTLQQTIKKGLPSGYGDAYDVADQAAQTIKSLYDTAAREIKPSVREMAQAVNKLVPESAQRTRSALKKVEKWATDNGFSPSSSNAYKEKQEEETISQQLGEIFTFQMQEQIKSAERSENQEKIRDGLNIARHRDQVSLLNRINMAVTRQAQYQDKVTSAYQKKSLELQYRSYYLQADMLRQMKESAEVSKNAYTAIVRNTSLPDLAKARMSENVKVFARNKFMSGISDSLFDSKSGVLGKAKDALVKTVQDNVRDFASVLSMAAMGIDTKASMAEMSGESRAESAGAIGGEWLAGKARDMGLEKLRKRLSKVGKVDKYGKVAELHAGNAMERINELIDDNRYKQGAKGIAARFASDVRTKMAPNRSLEIDSLENLGMPSQMTNQTNKSINEVIPGFLARILRELQVTRTGDDGTPLVRYDFMKNTFGNSTSLRKSAFDKVMPASQKVKRKNALGKEEEIMIGSDQVRGTLDEIFKLIDPEGKLSEDARKAFGKKLLNDRFQNKGGDIAYYTKPSSLRTKELQPHSEDIIKLMSQAMWQGGDDKVLDRRNAFSRQQKWMGSSVVDARSSIQSMMNAGMSDVVQSMGLVSDDGRSINIERLLEMYIDPNFDPSKEHPSEALSGPTSKRRGGRVTNNTRISHKTIVDNSVKNTENNSFVTNLATQIVAAINTQNNLNVHGQPEQVGTQAKLPWGEKDAKMIELLSNIAEYTRGSVESIRIGVAEPLSRIEQLIAAGAMMGGGVGVGGLDSDEEATESLRDRFKNAAKGKYQATTSWFKLTGQKMAGLGGSGLKAAINMHRAGSQHLRTAAGIATKAVGAGVDFIQEHRAKIGDVYYGKEPSPRMTALKMKAGMYKDKATGKLIKSLSDISGDVVDLEGNVVIMASELPELWARLGLGGKLLKAADFLTGKALNLSGVLSRMGQANMAMVSKTVGIVTKVVRDFIDGPGDVFVKGELEPMLLGIRMRAGAYIDAATGEVIRRMSDIKGPVKDAITGEFVLTNASLKKGVVDRFGKPIRGLAEKLIRGAAGMVGNGIRMAKNAAAKLTRGVSKAFASIGDASLAALDALSGSLGLTRFSKRSTEYLEKIYNVLNDRLPAAKKSVLGDTDGDGLREGSWQENAKLKKEGKAAGGANNKTTKEEAKKKERKNIFDVMAEAAKEKAGLIKDALTIGAELGGGSVLGKILKGGGGLLGKAGGFIGRGAMGLLGMGGLSGAATATTVAAEAAGGVAATTAAAGTATAATAAAGTAAAGTAATAAAGGGLMATIGSGLAATGTAIGSVVSAPVVLSALAIGLAAYGGYKLYKRMTNITNDPLGRYRLAQYGLSSRDDDVAGAIVDFEDLMEKQLVFKDGVASLTDKGLDYEKVFKIFEVKRSDDTAVNKWTSWFQNRFKPVFLSHCTALEKIAPGVRLSSLVKLKSEDKLKYLVATQMADSVYSDKTSPFPKIPYLVCGPRQVQAGFDQAKKVLEEEIAKNPSKEAKDASELADSAVAAGTVGPDGKIQADAAKKEQDKSFMNTVKNALNDFGAGLYSPLEGTTTGKALSFVGEKVSDFFSGGVSAFEAVRYRAYGLKSMELDKIRSLRKLEDACAKSFLLDASNTPQWNGSATDIFDKVGSEFYIAKYETEKVEAWTKWFLQRFLPVYTTFMGSLFQATGKTSRTQAENSLKPSQKFSIAQAVASANVWSVSYSPWRIYELNTKREGVDENLAALKASAKAVELAEEKAKTMDSKPAPTSAPGQTTPSGSNPVSRAVGQADMSKVKYVDPDTESPDWGKGGGGSGGPSLPSGSIPKLAGGEMRDGSGGMQYLKLNQNANLDGLNPDMRKMFLAMVQEYGEVTGKTVNINQAYRTYEQQLALWKQDPSKAAKPGTSLHEFGLAIDADSKTLDEMDSMGLMRKYGFTRPVGNEPWHVEPIGIQSNIAKYKNDPTEASKAMMASLGRGGGGWGTVRGVGGHGRNGDMAAKIFNADSTAVASANDDKTPTFNAPGTSTSKSSSMMKASYSFKQADSNPTDSDSGTTRGSRNGGVVPQTTSSMPSPAPASASRTTDGTESSKGEGIYAKIKDAAGSGWRALKDTLLEAAKAVGVDPKLLASVVAMESGFDPNAKSKRGSASGLLQFIKSTWNEMLGKYGKRLGIPSNASPYDSKAALLLGAQYIKENSQTLSSVKKNVTGADLYLGHLLGATGASKILGADQSKIAAQILPDSAASNPEIFYTNEGRSRTVGELQNFLARKVSTRLSDFGVDPSMFESNSVAGGAGEPTNIVTERSGDSRPVGRPMVPYSNGEAATAPISRTPTVPSERTRPSISAATQSAMPMSPAESPKPTIQQPQQTADLSADALKAINGTLTQSLSIQTEMLSVLKNIFGVLPQSSAKQEAAAPAPQTPKPAPSVPVPMGRGRVSV